MCLSVTNRTWVNWLGKWLQVVLDLPLEIRKHNQKSDFLSFQSFYFHLSITNIRVYLSFESTTFSLLDVDESSPPKTCRHLIVSTLNKYYFSNFWPTPIFLDTISKIASIKPNDSFIRLNGFYCQIGPGASSAGFLSSKTGITFLNPWFPVGCIYSWKYGGTHELRNSILTVAQKKMARFKKYFYG